MRSLLDAVVVALKLDAKLVQIAGEKIYKEDAPDNRGDAVVARRLGVMQNPSLQDAKPRRAFVRVTAYSSSVETCEKMAARFYPALYDKMSDVHITAQNSGLAKDLEDESKAAQNYIAWDFSFDFTKFDI